MLGERREALIKVLESEMAEYGFDSILVALSNICESKALELGQDENFEESAKMWRDRANLVANLIDL